MSDHNSTIGPHEARKSGGRLHAATQIMAAHKERQAAKAAANPARALMETAVQKGAGVALLWWARGEWPVAAKAQEAMGVGVVVGAAVVGLYLLMPALILTLMKLVAGFLPWVKRANGGES